MSRSKAPLQINGFEGGLNTELSPLEVLPNISADEVNMELGRDKSRAKRLGFDFETNYEEIDSGVVVEGDKIIARQLFRWENAGGEPDQVIMVAQVGNHLGMFNISDEVSISEGKIYEELLDGVTYSSYCSFAVIDGILVVATGGHRLKVYEYDLETNSVTSNTSTLKIRDLFGVEDTSNPSLTLQENLNIRPDDLSQAHIYNLRNQTFALPRVDGNNDNIEDPVRTFRSGPGLYPSNADNITSHIYADPSDEDDRLMRRFFKRDMEANNGGLSRAPMGYFVIDALKRGASREERADALYDQYPVLSYVINNLPRDETPGGPTVLSEFAGRVWYAGFSGELLGGDLKSPRMSSYVLFSVLVGDRTDIAQCYQRADPTSLEDSALVDTDGGFIRIDGAYGINRMVPISNSLFVFAENGVWRVTGGGGSAFTATSYEVEKITDKGCQAPSSITLVEKNLYFWGRDAIYVIGQNEFGVWETKNITQKTIQSFYLEIDFEKKQRATGYYDAYDRKIRWVYTGDPTVADKSEELVLHLDYQCFTPMEVGTINGELPLVMSIGETNPYDITQISIPVTSQTEKVTSEGEDVTVEAFTQVAGIRQVVYLVVNRISPTISYSFGYYSDPSFYDWGAEEVPYDAYLVTGFISGGEARYKKQSRYLSLFSRKTEEGFNGILEPVNPSSCLFSSRFNWTRNSRGDKWSTPRQAYRIGRLYFPSGAEDDYDDGDTMIVTRNKVRGIGHSVAFKFDSEPGKNMHIYGWAWDLQSNDVE